MSNDLATAARTFDGVGRYHTEIKVVIYSHLNPEPIDISADVISCSTSKTVKGIGSCSLTLTASKNYFLSIFANDYINIYFNVGDGTGWIRNFFGFIDRVSETSKVGESGIPNTTYDIVCSDFQKAFEKTQIYFNPAILGRRDSVSRQLGTPNIGGLTLAASGVEAHGSPPDMVLNVLYSLFGFASQFLLPDSLNPAFIERYRQQRQDFLISNLAPQIRSQIAADESFEAFYNRLNTAATQDAVANVGLDIANNVAGAPATPEAARDSAALYRRIALERELGGFDFAGQVIAAHEATSVDSPPTLLDIIDTSTYVERGSIDGYNFSTSIWQSAGSVMQILTGISNEMVNEMFFDLRPVTGDRELINTPDYARGIDETSSAPEDSIQMIPSLVMREYPFSTIAGVDARNAPTGLDNGHFGLISFGALFSHEPNRAGRHAITVPNINVKDQVLGSDKTLVAKHLDVVVLNSDQLIESNIGRSDAEHFNLLEAFSSDVLGESSRFFMNAELPILTPIHIVRHGLRVRTLDTQFARFDVESVRAQNAIVAQEATAPAATPATTPEPPATQIGSNPEPRDMRTGPNWQMIDRLWRYYEPYGCQGLNEYVMARSMYSEFPLNVPLIRSIGLEGVSEHVKAVGWCAKNIAMTGFLAGSRTGGHRWHNGTSTTTNIGEAIMGSGVPSRPRVSALYTASGRIGNFNTSTANFPGDISHVDPLDPTGHGDTYDPVAMNEAITSGRFADILARDLGANERLICDTLFQVARGILNGSIQDPGQTRGAGGSITFYHTAYGVSYDEVQPGQRELREDRGFRYYQIPGDPTLPPALGSASNIYARPEIAPSAGETPTSSPTDTGSPSTAGATVDNSATRSQLLRWALLLDHWFQHNLEYLSGSLIVRGNPLIRPGYRLDWEDRNLSFYIESVGQQWQYPNKLTTTIEVSRGQPSNPYPAYVLPATDGFNPTDTQRMIGSRLDSYFEVQDSIQTQRGVTLRDNSFQPYQQGDDGNLTDSPDQIPNYNENIAQSNNSDLDNMNRDAIIAKLGSLGENASEEQAAQLAKLLAEQFPDTQSTAESGSITGTVLDSGSSFEDLTRPGTGNIGNA